MRSKPKKALLANFDLMNNFTFQSGDQIIITNFDLMKTGKIIRSHDRQII